MKFLKVILKILSVLLLITLIAIFIIPYFFKDEIAGAVKTEVNKSLNATVDFEDFSLSLFKGFPDLSFEMHQITIQTKDAQTLLRCANVRLVIDLFSLMGDNGYSIKSLIIKDPDAQLRIAADGHENWDIIRAGEASDVTPDVEKSETFKLNLKHFRLSGGKIAYDDAQNGLSCLIDGLDLSLHGDLSADKALLDVLIDAQKINLVSEGDPLIKNVSVQFDGVLDADLKNEIYKFQKNTLKLNDLALKFDGSVASINEQLNLMLTFESPDNSFKQLLSLVPLLYQDSYARLSTSGNFSLDGYVKGMYTEDSYPSFQINMGVNNGMLSYTDMPYKLSEINLDATIQNKGGSLDNTIVDLRKMEGLILKDPFSVRLLLKHPISDPEIDFQASGMFDLSQLGKIFPQEEVMEVRGDLMVDMRLKGKLSAIEEERYSEFLAMGSVVAKQLSYQDDDFTQPVVIGAMQLNFSPSYVDLVGLSININNNDLKAEGKLSNYLAYYLNDDILSGNLSVNAKKINVNELLEPWVAVGENDTTAAKTTVSEKDRHAEGDAGTEVIEIPSNIDFRFALRSDSLVYDSLAFANLNASIHIHNSEASFDKVEADLLGGHGKISGFYRTRKDEVPKVKMNLQFDEVDVRQTYHSLVLFRQFTPIAESVYGNINLNLGFTGDLDQHMKPVWTTLSGDGGLRTKKLSITQSDFFAQFGQLLNSQLFDQVHTGPVDVKFFLKEGKIHHKPFRVKLNGVAAEIEGWTSFEQQVDYILTADLPVDLAGEQAGSLISQFISSGNNLGFDLGSVNALKMRIGITGAAQRPEIKLLSMGKGSGSLKESMEKEFEKKKEALIETAKEEASKILKEAQADADELMRQAHKRADNIMKSATESAETFKAEAQKQADVLLAEAKEKGPVATMLAKETTKELLKEGDKKAAEALKRASEEADKILKENKKKADQLLKEAQEKADRLK